MRLVTYRLGDTYRLGAVYSSAGKSQVVDLNHADPSLPADILELLAFEDEWLSKVRAALEKANHQSAQPLANVRLTAPIPRPGKIICIGLNYADHAQETGQELPDVPTVFGKFPNAVTGPYDPIVLPKVSHEVDYEAELAFVIGRTARRVAESDAMKYVAGYLVMNDVSARDFQLRTSQWTIGKSFDSFAPMGPYLVTSDEIADPHNLDVILSIGDEVLQSSNTNQLIFGIPELVSFLSRVMTLAPGDIIATGTPPGVGFVRQPPRFLKAGERVRTKIEGIGELDNLVVEET